MLDNGWEYAKKLHPKREWPDERALYCALPDDELPPRLAERRRRQRDALAAASARLAAPKDRR